MSSPNEPGYPRGGDGSGGGNGSGTGSAGSSGSAPDAVSSGASRAGTQQSAPAPVADQADVPPWQRGPAGRARQQAPEGAPGERRSTGQSGQSGLDARLNRFISGGAGPEAEPATRNERTDVVRTEGNRPEGNRPEQGSRPDPGGRPEPANRSEPARPETGGRPEPGGRAEPGSRPDPGGRPEGAAYGSELPDLSGPKPRPAQQRKPADGPPGEKPVRAPAPTTAVQVSARQHQGPVRASMQIRRIDPWSTLKVSLLLSVALFFVWMIAVAFLYLVLGGMGVWTKLNSNVGDLLTSASGSSGGELVSSGTIFGGAALIGLMNIVLLTAAATVGAFIYNLTTDLVGGVEVTLADRD